MFLGCVLRDLVDGADKPWHERVSLQKNVRNEIVSVTPIEDSSESEIGLTDNPDPEGEQQAPSLSISDRIANIESVLAPRVIEEERDRQLTQHQELVELAHSVPPEQLASLVSEATRHAVEERLGVAPREATMAEVLAEGERLAEAHVPNWNEVRDSVMDELVLALAGSRT